MLDKSPLTALLAWLQSGPDTLISSRTLIAWLEDRGVEAPAPTAPPTSTPITWRERLWTVPDDTRIGIAELCEALGRSKATVYRWTSRGEIPHRKLAGELVFVVGEIRGWLPAHEELIVPGRRRTA